MYIETAVVGLICTMLGAFIALSTFKRNGDKLIKDEAKENGRLELDVAYIKKGVDDIRIDIRENERKMQDMNEQLIIVKESVKSAHKRIDHIETSN